MTEDTQVFRLVYASRCTLTADGPDFEEQVQRILAVSRRNNPRQGITGALLFSSDCFAQTLEGSVEAVEQTFERIQLDRRHTDSVILLAGMVGAREFGDWSMAYAGRQSAERLRFDALTSVNGATAESEVLGLLRNVVLRAAPALAGVD